MSSGKAAVKGDAEPSEADATPSLEHLHVGVRNCLELIRTKVGNLCYTCKPKPYTPLDQVPTTISGIPVVIVPEPYEPIGASAWRIRVEDPPRHLLIDPGKWIEDQVIKNIWSTWREALRFYILLDGNLQLIIPPGFDVLNAYNTKPQQFGGLKVSYIRESFEPYNWGKAPAEESLSEKIEWPIKLRSRCTYKGKETSCYGSAGLCVRYAPGKDRDQLRRILFVPTPMIVEPLRHAKVPEGSQVAKVTGTDKLDCRTPLEKFRLEHISLTLALKNKDPSSLEVAPLKVMGIATYDHDIQSYPLGLFHGVSRVLLDKGLLTMLKDEDLAPPIHTERCSESTLFSDVRLEDFDKPWPRRLDYYHLKTDLLQDYTKCGSRRKKMAENGLAPSEGQCQLVGQGFFRHQRVESGDKEVATRSYLFRLHPASYDYPHCDLGSTLCFMGQREDGSPKAMVLGFTGFSQAVNTMDYVPELNKRCPDPSSESCRRSAFFGAYVAPYNLRHPDTAMSVIIQPASP